MMTTVDQPGVVIGDYRISIEAFEPLPPGADETNYDFVPSIPEKYSSVATSGLSVSVQDGMDPLTLSLED